MVSENEENKMVYLEVRAGDAPGNLSEEWYNHLLELQGINDI